MVSVLLMYRRVRRAFRHAVQEEEFLPVLSAALVLLLVGTATYAVGEGWFVVDGLYFAFSTLTTSNVADPDLVLTSAWLKGFTVLYQLIGIGIVIEIVRRLGMSFVAVQHGEQAAQTGAEPPNESGSEPAAS